MPSRRAGRPPQLHPRRPFTVWFAERERLELTRRALASGLSLGAYIRQTVLDLGPPKPNPPRVELDALLELRRQGNNLNQIAFHLNAAGNLQAELDHLAETLEANRETIRCLVKRPG